MTHGTPSLWPPANSIIGNCSAPDETRKAPSAKALISDSPLPTMTNPVAFGDTDPIVDPGEEADEYYALPSH